LIEHCFVESRESRDADDRLARLTEPLTEYIAEGSVDYEETIQDNSARLSASWKAGIRPLRRRIPAAVGL
jgi:hypothetical protein